MVRARQLTLAVSIGLAPAIAQAQSDDDLLAQLQDIAPSAEILWQTAIQDIFSLDDLVRFTAAFDQRPDLEDAVRFNMELTDSAIGRGRFTVPGEAPQFGDFLYSFMSSPDRYAMLDQYRAASFALSPVWTEPGINCRSIFATVPDRAQFDVVFAEFREIYLARYGQEPDPEAILLDLADRRDLEQMFDLEWEFERFTQPPVATPVESRGCEATLTLSSLDRDMLMAERQVVIDELHAAMDHIAASGLPLVYYAHNGDSFEYQIERPEDGYRFAGFGPPNSEGFPAPRQPLSALTAPNTTAISYGKFESVISEPIEVDGVWVWRVFLELITVHPMDEGRQQLMLRDHMMPSTNCTVLHDRVQVEVRGYLIGDACVPGDEQFLSLQHWPSEEEIALIADMPALNAISIRSRPDGPAPETRVTPAVVENLLQNLPTQMEHIDLSFVMTDGPVQILPEWVARFPNLEPMRDSLFGPDAGIMPPRAD